MARKVLITFLGTGPLIKREPFGAEVNKREYRTAKYHIDDKKYVSSFVADALTDHYDIDTVLIIGTLKSMWEEVYNVFCKKRGVELNLDYYTQIGDLCSNSNNESDLELPHKEEIEAVLGENSKIVLINYGLNEVEINQNIASILGIEKYLRNGDELYVDITHSFRSLPLLLMSTLIYMQNVSQKKVQIKHISYGMLDVSGELGYAPVVDLRKVIEVNEWISGAYSFSEFGNAYKIAKLLEPVNLDASNRLKDFSNMKNLNHIYALEKQVRQLSGIKLDELPSMAQMIISPVVTDFVRSIGPYKSSSEFQFKLARWHRDKHNYASSCLTLIEAIITYVCEKCHFAESLKEERDLAKGKILDDEKYRAIKNIYIPLNSIRNCLAHALPTAQNSESIIRILNQSIEKLGEILL